ncbi:hypothetical protein DMN91_007437, partial [Ooceraea biroi]
QKMIIKTMYRNPELILNVVKLVVLISSLQ